MFVICLYGYFHHFEVAVTFQNIDENFDIKPRSVAAWNDSIRRAPSPAVCPGLIKMFEIIVL